MSSDVLPITLGGRKTFTLRRTKDPNTSPTMDVEIYLLVGRIHTRGCNTAMLDKFVGEPVEAVCDLGPTGSIRLYGKIHKDSEETYRLVHP